MATPPLRRLAVVTHPAHGEGVVESLRRGGRMAVVRFESSPLPIEVPTRELEVVERRPSPVELVRDAAGEESEPTPAVVGPALAGSFETRAAALTLEAMRLGVVPEADIEAYTVGRDRELTLVEADLDAARADGGAVRAFLGDYGVGKTHLLELVQHRALARGYLTAFVMLDPNETTPSQPRRVYRALMRSLRYPDRPFEEGSGLEPLLERGATSPEARALFGVDPPAPGASLDDKLAAGFHLYLSPALTYMSRLIDAEAPAHLRGVAPEDAAGWLEQSRDLLLDWIEGHPTISNRLIDSRLRQLRGGGSRPKVYSLLDYRPWARIYGYLLSGLAALARAVGYEGLVVMLDEAEFYCLLSKENREYARHLFKAWTWAAIGAADSGGGAALPFEKDELNIGGYGIQQRLPGRYGDAAGLYTVFAMTPTTDGVEALEGAVPSANVHGLTTLDRDDYLELASRVCDFYASARPDWLLPEKLVGPLGKVLAGLISSGYVANPRQAMKFIIEFLDVVRFHPDRVGAVVRNLQQHVLL